MSIDDIDKELESLFDNPILEVNEEQLSLFDIPKHLASKNEREETDYVARREICKDFDLFDSRFKKVHKELKEGKRSLIKFAEAHFKEGTFFVVGGVLALLEKIHETKVDKHHKLDARTRVIFENGTESSMYLRSLGKALLIDGYTIQESTETNETALEDSFIVKKEDVHDGWIYVLRSLSKDATIVNQKDLYKIGFSTVPVEERIKNAEHEATYLMDKVEIVASWKTYNMNTHGFENIIHKFFNSVLFHMKVNDGKGSVYTPREWFVVPFSIMESVIEKIIDGSIIHYKYNQNLQVLEEGQSDNLKYSSEIIDTTGWAILTLNIKQLYFNQILKNEKNIEYRELKQNKLKTYTWVDPSDNKRYLKKFDAIRFCVGYKKDRDSALVEVVNTTYNDDSRQIEFHLGKILEVTIKN